MADPIRNQRQPADLTEAEVDAAVACVDGLVGPRHGDARDIYETLTWGQGPGVLSQSGLQDWLWYRLPTKYLTDEPGYMGRFAGVAAALFDALGLDRYAAICRSTTTAGVHEAFDRSDAAGFAAMRKAVADSGIDPPDLDDFAWGAVMGIEEANARAEVGIALEGAIADGGFVVGRRGWRSRQRDVTARPLDSEHPVLPGQSWRTAIVTERISTWADAATTRSVDLGRRRARVANHLLHPIAPPPDLAERLQPMTWFLDVFGDAQPLTQAGYLNTAFLAHVHAAQPWADPFLEDRPPRTETDAVTLHRLRARLEAMGALRKRGKVLERTARGAGMAADPAAAWGSLTRKISSDPWVRFAVETCALLLVDLGRSAPVKDVTAAVARLAAEMGWRTSGGRAAGPDPSELAVLVAVRDAMAMFELFGMLEEDGDWRHRHWTLTPAGTTTMLAILREGAAGPRTRPW